MFSFDNIANIASILGLIISIWTLVTAKSLKQRMIYSVERDEFKQNLENICGQIDGFINSINEGIYLNDNNRTFKPAILQFLTNIKSQFTFLSHSTIHQIDSIHKILETQNLSLDTWNQVSEKLITLKNRLKKEGIR